MQSPLLSPLNVFISAREGNIAPMTGRYTKMLSETRAIYSNQTAADALLRQGDQQVYEVQEYRVEGADNFFGTTIMEPGLVGEECFMTRGHFHADDRYCEIYYTQSGRGMLLLRSRSGETRALEMHAGSCSFIPPGWAHRSVNTGKEKLVFFWCVNQNAGHDYGDIATRGMGQRVMLHDGQPSIA